MTSRDTNMQMHANDTNSEKLIYPQLSYTLTGICFGAHNQLGRFAREKQYCDIIARLLDESGIAFQREYTVPNTGNRVDFLVENKIVLEAKAKNFMLKDDYYQLQRYLQALDCKLGLLVNFRNRYLKPCRVVRIDTDARKKFV
ncbi:MAG: GxxExxY protein [Candidatus Harrisonbacteria bacterium]|nr:GxxExxY protein [Candidatus Harrisonbacteria bacterium]